MRLALLPARAPAVEVIWRTLEAAVAPAYFLTWGWIGTWLEWLGDDAPELAAIFDGDRAVAAFFVARRRVVRHGLIPSRVRVLNATGIPRFDELCAEHNAILCDPKAPLTLGVLVELLPRDWDELLLPALSADAFPGRALGEQLDACRVRIDREVGSPYVDLARVRAAAGGYLSLLTSNARAQLRRARRGFGTLSVEVARDAAQAMDIYEELVPLQRARWRKGTFSDAWFDGFHRALIASRFPHGEIQLVRVRAEGRTVGCLYSFVSFGRVLFYQGGIARFEDPRLKPGYVCHAAAIEHDAAEGHRVYDFLGGEGRYKRTLATDEARLVWARVQRPRKRFAVEERLRSLKRAAVRLVGNGRRTPAP